MREGQETRERIAARAAELFNTRGYGGTAIADVMAAAGLEKGGVYRHFASKDEPALAAFDYAAGIVRGCVDTAASTAADLLPAVVEVFRGYVSVPPLPGGCPILIVTVEGAVMLSRVMNDPNPLHWAADHLHEHIDVHLRLPRP